MRELTRHRVNGCNDGLKIEVRDEPGNGGANHEYRISGWHDTRSATRAPIDVFLIFQNGPIKEVGVNGITHEALLAILIDRLEGFQSGPFKCDYNRFALEHLKLGLEYLKQRTAERMLRGVEGTHAQ